MTERYTPDELYPLETHRAVLQCLRPEDYVHTVLQAIVQEVTGKLTQEFIDLYNERKGHIPLRRLLEFQDHTDLWERHKKAFETTMIVDHNDRVRHTGVGEIIGLQLLDPAPESQQSTVEEV